MRTFYTSSQVQTRTHTCALSFCRVAGPQHKAALDAFHWHNGPPIRPRPSFLATSSAVFFFSPPAYIAIWSLFCRFFAFLLTLFGAVILHDSSSPLYLTAYPVSGLSQPYSFILSRIALLLNPAHQQSSLRVLPGPTYHPQPCSNIHRRGQHQQTTTNNQPTQTALPAIACSFRA